MSSLSTNVLGSLLEMVLTNIQVQVHAVSHTHRPLVAGGASNRTVTEEFVLYWQTWAECSTNTDTGMLFQSGLVGTDANPLSVPILGKYKPGYDILTDTLDTNQLTIPRYVHRVSDWSLMHTPVLHHWIRAQYHFPQSVAAAACFWGINGGLLRPKIILKASQVQSQ